MTSTDNHVNQVTGSHADLRYLALGDSYTIGEAVDVNESWPVQLANLLGSTGIELTAVEIIAQTGWTTGELLTAIRSKDPQGPYDLVTLLIGVNNKYRHLDTSTFRSEIKSLLQMSIYLAGNNPGKVIVVSIPDYGITPFAQNMDREIIAKEIDVFNAIKYDETVKAGVKFVDITPVSRKAAVDPSLIADDGLHPSGKMYTEWVRLIYPLAQQILEAQIFNK